MVRWAVILGFTCTLFLGFLAGCGKGELGEDEALAQQVKICIECNNPACKKRFSGNLLQLQKGETVICPYCGDEFKLDPSEHSCRYGVVNKKVSWNYEVVNQRGQQRKPWASYIKGLNTLEGTRFDRVTRQDVHVNLENGQKIVRGPYPMPQILDEKDREDPPAPDSTEPPRPELWFKAESWADKAKIKDGIPNDSGTLPNPSTGEEVPMFKRPEKTKAYVQQVETSEEAHLKEILAPHAMKQVGEYVAEVDQYYPQYPATMWHEHEWWSRLRDQSTQETVQRFPNDDRDHRADDATNAPVSHEFHRFRKHTNPSGEMVVESERGKMKSFGPVEQPPFWAASSEHKLLWDRKDYEDGSKIENYTRNTPPEKKTLLGVLREEYAKTEKGWTEREANPVVTSTGLLDWLKARIDYMADVPEYKEIDLDRKLQMLENLFENKRNKYFKDAPKLETGDYTEEDLEWEPPAREVEDSDAGDDSADDESGDVEPGEDDSEEE